MTPTIARRCLILAAAAAMLPAVGCSTNPATGERELILIPRDQEIAMGVQAAPEFEKEFGGKVDDQRLQDYVSSVGQKVAAVSDRPMPYEYTLVKSDIPNAFALPGGKIFITAGLMERMTSERQLAAVLGHETAHVAAKHNVKGMQRQMGAAVLAEVAGAVVGGEKAETAKAVTEIVAGVTNLKYSRGDEYQADEYGIRYMARAGYNPWGMVELLTVLYRMAEAEGGEGGSLSEMFQTHPLSSKRIEAARKTIEGNNAYKKFSADVPDPGRGQFAEMKSLLP